MNHKERIVNADELRCLAIEIESANRMSQLYMSIAQKSTFDKKLSADHIDIASEYAHKREKYAHQFKQLAKELYESI